MYMFNDWVDEWLKNILIELKYTNVRNKIKHFFANISPYTKFKAKAVIL